MKIYSFIFILQFTKCIHLDHNNKILRTKSYANISYSDIEN